MKRYSHPLPCLLLLLLALYPGSLRADTLQDNFAKPPPSAHPWVYWFWLNGNITSNGITADLEAMKRVGIAGVLIMEVEQRAPLGPVDFMGPQWRNLFKHVVAEARRLGLEVNMNDDAGWNGSGGPWIRPEQSMQKVVWSETNLTGPLHFEGALAPPETLAGFYRDIAVEAFPATSDYRIPDIKTKAGYQVRGNLQPAHQELAPTTALARDRILDLSPRMNGNGHLVWDAPPGAWTVVRFGHTSTGMENKPPPKSGRGLECDKLSAAGIEANFAGMMAKLVADTGVRPGRKHPGLVTTHIDSWENGAQNWTARMAQEFRQRRGYELTPFLPVLTGRVVGSLELSERFLWDLRQTISDLVVECYAGRMQMLAHEHGLRLSIEAYGCPSDSLTYGGRCDEPMGEFWMGQTELARCKGMTSAGHIYGRPIIGAEAFTAGAQERWLDHPGSIKARGDLAFCSGINRFVFHRYALQPWQADRRPGMTMGPWGLHYERTQTWWEESGAWHEYLARCQFLLRQGRFVADLCVLQPEESPQGFQTRTNVGFDYDLCNAEVVLTRMTVKDGRLMLPDGMSYQLLVLPEHRTMTPPLLRRIKALVQAGATVVGPPPQASPSLTGYPQCDDEVKQLVKELWGACDGRRIQESRFGQGHVYWGLSPEQVLAARNLAPDFSGARLSYIHRAAGDTDIYFVANPNSYAVQVSCAFRVVGKTPEFWWPDTGRTERVAHFESKSDTTSVPIVLPASGSGFVIFRSHRPPVESVVRLTRDGEPLFATTAGPPKLTVLKATYGVPGDPQRTRDVRAEVQQLVDEGQASFPVSQLAKGGDPARLVVKTLVVEYEVGGRQFACTNHDRQTMRLDLPPVPVESLAEVRYDRRGRLELEAPRPGHYELQTAAGRTLHCEVPSLLPAVAIEGPWEVNFAPGWGAPNQVTLPRLISWSEHSDPGVKYFSGTAIYRKAVTVAPALLEKGKRLYLDLGAVHSMARVKLNGQDLGLLWKVPYSLEITHAARPGQNQLELKVINLWPNRLIGDEQFPEDNLRNADGTLQGWPAWLLEGKPNPAGRFTFTSWQLWKKNDPLLPSGLLGPVGRRTTQVALPVAAAQ